MSEEEIKDMKTAREAMGFGPDAVPLYEKPKKSKKRERMRGIFSTPKSNQTIIRTLSPLAMDAMIYYDVHPDVEAIHSHPLKVSLVEADRYGPVSSVEHIPEFGIWDRFGRATYFDVIYVADQQEKPWLSKRTGKLKEALWDYRAGYNVLDEYYIYQQPKMRNVRLMRYHARVDDAAAVGRVRDVLSQLGPFTTVDHVSTGAMLPVLEYHVFSDDGRVIQRSKLDVDRAFTALMYLATKGEVSVDLSTPFGDHTRVTVLDRFQGALRRAA